ncbi:uncharacterized protein LOC129184736 [Dunckerocampus dactyliophorus]|uniref:uncharacterized protein LOC129184736 n=1 Tax=Dunckerocampus dactyliophorus TaxID=161453 RepID=UPI00240689A6|nr:uncharacterized protein LOC129184736 [Dunckerocampus dactyliophorus]
MTTEASAASEADTEGKQKASAAEPEPENKQSPEATTSEPEGEQLAKKTQDQATEPGPANVASSPEEDQLKPRTRTSAGKGLSRLFSSFLKRRSQCSEGEGFEAEKAREEKEDKEEKTDNTEEEKEEKVKTEEEAHVEQKSDPKEVNKSQEKPQKEEKKTEPEKLEKKGSKKKKKEAKKKTEEKDTEKVKTTEAKREEKQEKKSEEEENKAEQKEEAKVEGAQEKEEDKLEPKEKTTAEVEDTGTEAVEERKDEEKVDKKGAKKKEKEERVKKKEEEKAKRKAEEEERAKKREEENKKKREDEKVKEAEKAKKKEEEKAKKKEEEEKAKEEKIKRKEEEKSKEAKKKEEEKLKEVKKKEEEKLKEAKKKEEEKLKEAKKKEEEKLKEAKKKDEKLKEAKKKEEDKLKETKRKEEEKLKEATKEEEEKGKEDDQKKTEDKEKKKEKGKKEKEEGEKASSEKKVKAPIAAPEPELKTEPETEPAPEQHSLSSTEMQPAPEEHKEQVEIKEDPEEVKEVKEDGAEKNEEEPEEQKKEAKEGEKSKEEVKEQKPAKEKKTERKGDDVKGSKRQKTIQCKVTLLDDTQFECELDKHAKGQELITKVCDHLNLLEKDYFGLAHWETPSSKTWLEHTKEIRKQVPGAIYEFTFNIKFYPPDPAQLTEDLTRYYLCLQLRKDIMSGVLPCSFVTLSLLGSYTAQSELGEYDPEVHAADYVKDLSLAPGQSKELEDKVMELHRTYRSMSPAQADMLFLENAKKLAMYGVDLHQAKDLDGVDITLGVCSSGLMVYKDKLRINRFPWPKVLKISYKRSSFFIKIRPSEQEQYESTIGFKLPNYKASKKLWKVCVEHHTFFRVSTIEAPSSRRFLVLGSKFRYSGRTQAQTRQASSMIDRPAPRFTRSASKRLSRNLDGAGDETLQTLTASTRSEVDDWSLILASDKPYPFLDFPARGHSEQIIIQSWNTQEGGPPWWELSSDAQLQTRKKDEWSTLLKRHPSFPFSPSFDFVKQPAKLSLADVSSVDRLLQPAQEQHRDWFRYCDRTPSLSFNEYADKLQPQIQVEDEQTECVTEQELTDKEITERLEAMVMLVDNLEEMEDLERRLRKVRDLEERLQEVDEMADRIQEVIEEELGEREVAKLKEEQLQKESEAITWNVLKHSVMMVRKSNDGEEVDELEEQIKEVFLKGLLPAEEETKVDSKNKAKDASLFDSSLREKLRQLEEEWQNEMEEKFSLPQVIPSPGVTYHRVERTKKRVAFVDQQQPDAKKDAEAKLMMSEKRLGDIRLQTEIKEEKAESVMEMLDVKNRSQLVEEKDMWATLFDRPPYTAIVKPPVTSVERVDLDEGEFFTSKAAVKIYDDERILIPQESSITKKRFPQPQTVLERDDDWFVLLDIVTKETTYVQPVNFTEQDTIEAESLVSVVEMYKEIREVPLEERERREEPPRHLQEIRQHVVKERDDDWFVLLDVVPKETTYVQPVTFDVPGKDDVSLADMTEVEMRDKPLAIGVVEETEIKDDLSLREVTMLSQGIREIQDDWFLLLDVPTRETQFVPPGIADFPPFLLHKAIDGLISLQHSFCQVTMAVHDDPEKSISTLTEEKVEVEIETIMVHKIEAHKKIHPEQKIVQPVVNSDDDWFLLLDIGPREITFVPTGTYFVCHSFVLFTHIRKPTNSKFHSKTDTLQIPGKIDPDVAPVSELKRAEEELPQFGLYQTRQQPFQSQPENDDDWFVVFDAIREEAMAPVTPVEITLPMRKPFETEVLTTESRTWDKMVIGESRHDETRLSKMRPSPVGPTSGREGEDDWFVLFDIITEKTAAVPSVAVVEHIVDVVALKGPKPKYSVEDARPPVKFVEIKPPWPREVEDDWFVLLDVAEKAPVPEPVRSYPDVASSKGFAVIEKSSLQRITIVQEMPSRQQPCPKERQVEDDWCILLDVAQKKSVAVPERIRFPAEVPRTAEVKTRIPVFETRPQFEKQILEERPPLKHTRVDDDWFVLLDTGLRKSVVVTQKSTRPVSAPVFSQAALAEAGIPMAPLEQPQTSTPIRTTIKEERTLEVTLEAIEPSKTEDKSVVWRDHRSVESSLTPSINGDIQFEVASTEVVQLRKKRAKKIEGDSIYIRHSLLMLEEFDKPQEDLLRHHASISELKRNFMEAVPESRPSEWDKRLSTHSPLRSVGVNGQPSADGSVSISPLCSVSAAKAAHEETIATLDFSNKSSPTVGHCRSAEAPGVPVERPCDQEKLIVFKSSLVPMVQVEMAQVPPLSDLSTKALNDIQGEEGSGLLESSRNIVGSSPASYFRSGGPQVIRSFQPPLVQTHTVTITAASNSLPSGISTTEVPIVPTQTVTYESSKGVVDGTEEDKESTTVSISQTSETTSGSSVTTTTTHISKIVKSGSSETRVEKRIVITADSDIDHDQGTDGGASAL